MKIRYPDEDEDMDDDGKDDDVSDPAFTATTILTRTYVLVRNQMQELGEELWNQNFFEALIKNANAPLDNIVSCKLFPLDIDRSKASPLIIGNVKTGLTMYEIGGKMVYSSESLNFKGIFTKRSFLNYEPFTKVTLYLPFVGNVSISPQELVDSIVQIKWIVDYVTGSLETCVMINHKQRFIYNSQCGVDIPLSASNRSVIEANSLKNAVFSLAGMNVIGVAQAVTEGVSGMLGNGSTSQNGTPSSSTSICTDMNPYFVIERVQYSENAGYEHVYGCPLRQWWQLGYLAGYTECDNVDTTGIPATESEKAEIKRLLESGVYL